MSSSRSLQTRNVRTGPRNSKTCAESSPPESFPGAPHGSRSKAACTRTGCAIAIRRYIQADPLGLVDGASVYTYALQNPVRWTDPRGERGVPSTGLGGSFGIVSPPVGFGVNPHSDSMSPWPLYKPLDPPDPANFNEGPQCSQNSCMLKSEVSPQQLADAGLDDPYGNAGRTKGCVYRCPGGKMKMNLLTVNFSCPKTISDFPFETFNNLSSSDLLRLRAAGVRY